MYRSDDLVCFLEAKTPARLENYKMEVRYDDSLAERL